MSQIGMKMLFLAAFLVICGVSKAAVYNVGDSKGWTSIGDIDYKSWAASKHFQVGDTIVFQYKNEFHNVVRVSHKNYNLCNATGSYRTWTSGNDSFTIPRAGHYFFICSFPEHCEGGQKVDIRVPGKPSPKIAPSPSPISNHPKPGSPKASAPHVAPKSSPSTTPAPKASAPHVAPKTSPSTTPPPKASSPHVAPKSSPVATPPTPKASSPDAAPESSLSPPDDSLPNSPAPSPTSSTTRSLPMKNLFFVAAIGSIFCL